MFEMEFPPEGQPIGDNWWAPLEAVASVVADEPHYRFFDLADFMHVGKLRRREPRPDLLIYKHRFTRRYLHLDEAGHAYRYVAPARSQPGTRPTPAPPRSRRRPRRAPALGAPPG